MTSTKALGRLKTLGIAHEYELPLYLPTGYSDYSRVVTDFDVRKLEHGRTYVFEAHLARDPTTKSRKGQPLTSFHVTDYKYLLQFCLFGDVRETIDQIKSFQQQNIPFYVAGELVLNNGAFINGAKIIDRDKVGTIESVYPGVPDKLKPETVRKLIHERLEKSVPGAAAYLREQLMKIFKTSSEVRQFIAVERLTLDQLLEAVHKPCSYEQAIYALNVMKRIGAIAAATELIERARNAEKPRQVTPIIGQRLDVLLSALPFKLTEEQRGIIDRTIDSLYDGLFLDLVLIGDVGTGKSICFMLPVAYVATGGKRAAIMLPNTNLALQIHAEFSQYFPEIAPVLVTGSSEIDDAELKKASVLIGTTAMLFRDIGQIQLCVIDEQQKLSTEQREQLCSVDTHRIAVSATPIPRTTALATYGAVKVEKITHCHAQKTIHTRVFNASDYGTLVGEILWTIHSAGSQALIVCSRKEEGSTDARSQQESDEPELLSVERVYAEYDALLPGLVALSHGGLTQEQNQQALDSIRSGEKRVLVATSVVEIGVTLPSLSYCAVFDAQQFALNSLHQLRGRLVRHGGVGYFTMYVPRQVKNPATHKRLSTLIESNDGHFIAMQDLKLRGLGDIANGSTQHGKYKGIVRNVDIDIDELESVLSSLA